METVIVLLAAAGMAVVLLLSIPVDVAVNLETAATDKLRFRLIWLFGLLDIRLASAKHKPGDSQSKEKENKKVRTNRRVIRQMSLVLRTHGLRAAFVRLIRRLVAAVTVRDFSLRMVFGFDDPAETGLLLAVAAPAMALMKSWVGESVSAEADFDNEIFCANGNLRVRIYPLRVAGASAMFLLSPPALRAAKAVIWNR